MRRQLEGKTNPDEIVLLETLSKEYGWTPSQIRQESYNDMTTYLDIVMVKRKIEEAHNKKHGK